MHTVVLIALKLIKVTIWRHVLEDYAKVDGKLDKNCSYENFESVNKDTLI